MKNELFYFAFAAMVALLMASCDPTDPGAGGGGGDYPEALDKLVPGASFVAKGKVLVLHTSLTEEEDVSQLGVVELSEVIDAPEAWRGQAGQQITVRFADIGSVKEGEERLFFTEPYWFGEFLAVTEKGSVGSSDKLYADKDLAKHVQAARANLADQDLGRVLKASPLVLTGKVVAVAPGKVARRATEHDPEWMEAEIQIDEILSGKADGPTVKVLFAASKDVMFYRSPKLRQGDDGIFTLEKADEQLQKLSGLALKLTEPKAFVAGREQVKLYKSLLK